MNLHFLGRSLVVDCCQGLLSRLVYSVLAACFRGPIRGERRGRLVQSARQAPTLPGQALECSSTAGAFSCERRECSGACLVARLQRCNIRRAGTFSVMETLDDGAPHVASAATRVD